MKDTHTQDTVHQQRTHTHPTVKKQHTHTHSYAIKTDSGQNHAKASGGEKATTGHSASIKDTHTQDTLHL